MDMILTQTEAVAQRCSVKKVLLEISQNSQENTCARAFFNKDAGLKACNFIKKEDLAQVFSCEFCEIPIKKVFLKILHNSQESNCARVSFFKRLTH